MKSKTLFLFAAIAAVLLLLFSRRSSGAVAPVGSGTLPITGNPLANLASALQQSLSGLASTGPPTAPGTAYGVTGGQQGPPAPDLIDPLSGNLYSDESLYSPAAGVSLGDATPIDVYSGVSA
jgi:hypothetical protein